MTSRGLPILLRKLRRNQEIDLTIISIGRKEYPRRTTGFLANFQSVTYMKGSY